MLRFEDIAGLVGVMLTLLAYALLQFRRLHPEGVAFSGMNAIGSILILYSLIATWNLSAFAMEACWLLISLYGVFRYFFWPPRKILNRCENKR